MLPDGVDIRCTDCMGADGLLSLPDNSVDAVVTDPPYELGFMGKKWDSTGIAYNVDLWREVLRVLKPGGHLLAFGGTRTYHRMAVAIEDAGFEIRDSLHWMYGSGFPKSLDISKAIHKAALATADVARQWDGWGTALKPAHEPVVIARKPLYESNVAANVLKWGAGGVNVDGCRIDHHGNIERHNTPSKSGLGRNGIYGASSREQGANSPTRYHETGRWPPNVLLTHSADCTEGECAPDCPVAELDRQSGWSRSSQRSGRRAGKDHVRYGAFAGQDSVTMGHNDEGGASRFFPVFRWDVEVDFPFRYVPKPSAKERNAGCEDLPKGPPPGSKRSKPAEGRVGALGQPRANHHPTTKPLALMRWLCRLVTPPGGIVLDHFLGSGTTGMAAAMEGFRFIGFEREPEYHAIAEARIRWAVEMATKDAKAKQQQFAL